MIKYNKKKMTNLNFLMLKKFQWSDAHTYSDYNAALHIMCTRKYKSMEYVDKFLFFIYFSKKIKTCTIKTCIRCRIAINI